MAHNTRIKPQAGDTVGLTALYSRIGTDISNCRVLATKLEYTYATGAVKFEAQVMWNNTTADAYLADENSVNPIKREQYEIGAIDLDKSLVDQCLDYLLTLPQYNGSQGGGTLVWVKQ